MDPVFFLIQYVFIQELPALLIHMLLHDYIQTFTFINLPKHPVSVLINTIVKIIVVILCTSRRSERVQSASLDLLLPSHEHQTGFGALELWSFGALAAGWGQTFNLHHQSWS